MPVWQGLVINDGICSRLVPQSNANFCRLLPRLNPPPPDPPARLPLTDVKRNLYCQSHILFTLFTCTDNPELCVRECVLVSVCYPCVCVCVCVCVSVCVCVCVWGGFHMNGRSCEDAAGLYVAVCTMCVCARCCKVASTHVFFAFFF